MPCNSGLFLWHFTNGVTKADLKQKPVHKALDKTLKTAVFIYVYVYWKKINFKLEKVASSKNRYLPGHLTIKIRNKYIFFSYTKENGSSCHTENYWVASPFWRKKTISQNLAYYTVDDTCIFLACSMLSLYNVYFRVFFYMWLLISGICYVMFFFWCFFCCP